MGKIFLRKAYCKRKGCKLSVKLERLGFFLCYDMLALGRDITVECNSTVHCIAVQYGKVICMAKGRIIPPSLARLVPGAA